MAKQSKKTVQRPPVATAATKPKAAVESAIDKTIRSYKLKLALILGAIAFLIYANSIRNGYVLDDSSVITENTIVQKGTAAIGELLTTPYRRGFFITSNDLYRPLSLVMVAIEYELFGLNPMPNHLMNVLLFAGCIILLFYFLDRFFNGTRTAVAFIATLLFAVHPIHTEVVANIKSRDELLCFFFVFLSLNVFFKYLSSGKAIHLLLGSFCFLLSMLSKETVVTFLAIIPLIFFFYHDENKKRSIHITLGVIAMIAIALFARFSVLAEYNANGMSDIDFADNALALKTLSASSRIATAVMILGYYIKLLFIPYPLTCDYGFNTIPFTTFGDWRVLLSLAVYGFLGIYGIMRFIKNKKDPYAFAILFYLITMSLFSNVPFLIGSTMGERFLFFGSLGYCLAIALILEKWAGNLPHVITYLKNPKVLVVLAPVCIAYSALAINRNADWYSNFTLYGADVVKSSNSTKLNYFYGLELEKVIAYQEKDPEKQKNIRLEGIKYLRKSVAIDPEFGNAQSDLGNSFFCIQEYDSAIAHEEIALQLNPINNMAANNLASVYYFTKNYRKSIDLSMKALAIKPDYVNAYSNIGRTYLSMGRVDSAMSILYKGIAVDPNYTFNYELMTYAFRAINQPDSVRKYEALAQRGNPAFKAQ